MTFASQTQSRIFTTIKSRVSKAIKSRVSTIIESRVSTTIESRVLTPLKFVSPLEHHDNHVRAAFSHIKGVSLYFCNQFNSILAEVTDNSTGSIVYQRANQSS